MSRDYRDDSSARSVYRGSNYVRTPTLRTNVEQQVEAQKLLEGLHKIDPVSMVVVFDEAPPKDRVELVNPSAPVLFDLLSRANLQRGSVIVFKFRGEDVPGFVLAKLNWFLHIHGYTRGFRGWKIQQQELGGVCWGTRFAWANLRIAIGLQ